MDDVILNRFVQTEREIYPGQGNNRFAFALEQPARYERFVRIIVGRYRETSAAVLASQNEIAREFASNFGEPGRVRPDQLELLERQESINTKLHLEIETFYLFAKILLDHVARYY